MVASPLMILPSGRNSFVNMGVLERTLSGQNGQLVFVLSTRTLSSLGSEERNLPMYPSMPPLTVVFLPVRGSMRYSNVIVSSSKFFNGLKILVCLMVFMNSINAKTDFYAVGCSLIFFANVGKRKWALLNAYSIATFFSFCIFFSGISMFSKPLLNFALVASVSATCART